MNAHLGNNAKKRSVTKARRKTRQNKGQQKKKEEQRANKGENNETTKGTYDKGKKRDTPSADVHVLANGDGHANGWEGASRRSSSGSVHAEGEAYMKI